MCKVIDIELENRKVRVADIKKKYIDNIVSSAKDCKSIDKVILFGSCIGSRCTDRSDIDIAVFGSEPKGKVLKSKEFLCFANNLAKFDDFLQTYDILYFKTGVDTQSPILKEISNGEVLYVRK